KQLGLICEPDQNIRLLFGLVFFTAFAIRDIGGRFHCTAPRISSFKSLPISEVTIRTSRPAPYHRRAHASTDRALASSFSRRSAIPSIDGSTGKVAIPPTLTTDQTGHNPSCLPARRLSTPSPIASAAVTSSSASILIAPPVVEPSDKRRVFPPRLTQVPSGFSAVLWIACDLLVSMLRMREISAGCRSCPKGQSGWKRIASFAA